MSGVSIQIHKNTSCSYNKILIKDSLSWKQDDQTRVMYLPSKEKHYKDHVYILCVQKNWKNISQIIYLWGIRILGWGQREVTGKM